MILLAVLACGSLGLAMPPAGGGADSRTVELSFTIPVGEGEQAGVALVEGGLIVRLPPGGGVPADIAAESRGLALSGSLYHEPDGSLRYELQLGSASLDQVLFLSDRLVILLRSNEGAWAGTTGSHSYLLGADDKVQVSVGGHPDLLTLVVVKSNGMITAPLVGEVQAAGRSVQEIAAEVAARLESDFLVNPQVDVQVVEYNSQWVLVTGQVMTPRRVPLRGGTTLEEVIAEAGGLTALAGSRLLVADNPAGPGGGGKPQVVDRREFETGLTHVVPRHGSIINVEKVAYAYIEGEIKSSGTVRLEPGMTLLKAIAVSGGLTEWADRKGIRILDAGGSAPARVYNLKRIQAQKDPDPPIEKGQMIIVPRRGV